MKVPGASLAVPSEAQCKGQEAHLRGFCGTSGRLAGEVRRMKGTRAQSKRQPWCQQLREPGAAGERPNNRDTTSARSREPSQDGLSRLLQCHTAALNIQ